jgi:hypothetical protein
VTKREYLKSIKELTRVDVATRESQVAAAFAHVNLKLLDSRALFSCSKVIRARMLAQFGLSC